jgi:CheY-like chemotaxis protein
MKVLTVDDSRMIRTLVRKYLAPFNMEILEAENGEQGLAMARQHLPELVILDVNMPVMDGPEMLRNLRSDPATKGLKVLMLTAESGEKLVLEVIKMGISDYIVKPFEEELLVKKVTRIIQADSGKQPDTGLRRVLILDDNESVLMVARKFLDGIAEVLTASKPDRALQMAAQQTPQVALLDLGTDGLQVFESLKKEGKAGSTRFVVLTTKSMADKAEEAQKAGFADVLFKPFDKEALNRVVAG